MYDAQSLSTCSIEKKTAQIGLQTSFQLHIMI